MTSKKGGVDIDKLISRVTDGCDSFTEGEFAFKTAVEEEVVVWPFEAKVVGETVEVESISWDGEETVLVANCRRKGRKYVVPLTVLEVPPNLHGREYLDAYREFHRSGVL